MSLSIKRRRTALNSEEAKLHERLGVIQKNLLALQRSCKHPREMRYNNPLAGVHFCTACDLDFYDEDTPYDIEPVKFTVGVILGAI